MPHICRQVWQHNSQVVAGQNPFFKAFDGKSVAKTVDSRAHGRVRDVGHKQIIPEMVVSSALVHLPHCSVVITREKPHFTVAIPMESIHKSENAFCQTISHGNQSVFHVFRDTNCDGSGFQVYIIEKEIECLRNPYACAVQKSEQYGTAFLYDIRVCG